jgi:hypothetical protein
MRQEQATGRIPPSDRGERRATPVHLGTGHHESGDAAKACLRASHLLRRFVHRQLGTQEPSRAVALTTCQLLDALSRALHNDPDCLPPPVVAAALRLSERIGDLPPTPYPTRAPSRDPSP